MRLEIIYEKKSYVTKVIYGETFAATLPSLDYRNKHLIIITNQRYYDLFSEKINQLLHLNRSIDWYICTNQTRCNTIEELNHLILFLSRFAQEDEYLFLAFGNEGVVELTSFVQKNAVLKGEFWILPVSIRSFAQGLTKSAAILSQREQKVLQIENMPRLILYDQTLTEDQTTGKMVDLLVFAVCGILCDHSFLKNLYKNYPNRKNLQMIPFTGMIESMIRYYESYGELIEDYGTVFERAFYYAEGGHLLSSSMKRMLGVLFQLKWNLEIEAIPFNFRNFLVWFVHLGYPIGLPKEFLIGDYVESVLMVLKKSEELLCLEKIGKIKGLRKAKGSEILTALEGYQRIAEDLVS